jgi:hypothetical protein
LKLTIAEQCTGFPEARVTPAKATDTGPFPSLRPKRAAYGVADLRSGSGQRGARHALMSKPLASKPRPKLFHLTYR